MNAVKAVTQYQATDKTLHTTKGEAKAHNAKLVAVAELKTLLQSSVSTGRAESILAQILLEGDKVSGIISTYRKSQPRQPKNLVIS